MIDVEQGVPIVKNKRGRPPKYPFRNMKVGDSFFAKSEDGSKSAISLLQASIMGACRRNRVKNAKFTTAQEENGVRCWRES